MVDGNHELGGLVALPQQRHFIEGNGAVPLAGFVNRRHAERMDGGELCRGQSLRQIGLRVIVHQETDCAPVHPVYRNAC